MTASPSWPDKQLDLPAAVAHTKNGPAPLLQATGYSRCRGARCPRPDSYHRSPFPSEEMERDPHFPGWGGDCFCSHPSSAAAVELFGGLALALAGLFTFPLKAGLEGKSDRKWGAL